MKSLESQYDSLVEALTEILGEKVTNITVDGQNISPSGHRPSLLIEPPEITSSQWNSADVAWKIDIIAGTTTTQATAMFDCLSILTLLLNSSINVANASPISFRNNGIVLAGYQVTLNPLEN